MPIRTHRGIINNKKEYRFTNWLKYDKYRKLGFREFRERKFDKIMTTHYVIFQTIIEFKETNTYSA